MLSLFTTIANADGHAKANAFAITLKVPASDVAKVEEMLKTHHKCCLLYTSPSPRD